MRVILVLLPMFWTLCCYGQVIHGTQEAFQRFSEIRKSQEESQERYEQAYQAGHDLFGADLRWNEALGPDPSSHFHVFSTPNVPGVRRPMNEDSEFAGTLFGRMPKEWRIGDWGCTCVDFLPLSKVSDTEYLVDPFPDLDSEPVLLRGFDSSKLTDGRWFLIMHPLVIRTTFEYPAVSGAKKTVLVLERNDAEFTKHLFRTWTDDTGSFSIQAKLVDFSAAGVHLQRENGAIVQVPMSRLSKADQQLIRDKLAKQREKAKDLKERQRKQKTKTFSPLRTISPVFVSV